MAKFVDLTWQRFGYLIALEPIRENGIVKWKCICDCGKTTITAGSKLVSGHTKSCGCLQRKRTSESCRKDLSGRRFGRLTVVERIGNIGESAKYQCICDCGNIVIVAGNNLVTGATKSCGCLRKETAAMLKFSHGQSASRLYHCWRNMLNRCENPKNNEYKNYGARGISVCKEWHEFMPFYQWALSSEYQDDLTIERKDVNRGYSPDNCTWATRIVQARNRTDNVKLSFDGKTMILSDWAKKVKINERTIQHRLKNGWSVEQALTTRPGGAAPRP